MTLLNPQQDRLEKYCLSLTGNIDDAKDLTSDTILQAYLKLEQLKDEAKFPHYIFKIAKRIYIKKLRSIHRFFRYDTITHHISDKTLDPSELLDLVIIYEALSKLPLKLKQAVILHEISGFPLKEVAEIENCSLSAAKARVMRGRNKLQDLLSDSINTKGIRKKHLMTIQK